MLTALVALFGAGLASVLAPCVLPLVPVYLGMVTGEVASERPDRALRATAVFVVGFGGVFVAVGTAAGAVGASLGDSRGPVARIGGVLMIGFGLVMAGVGGRWSQRATRLRLALPAGAVARPLVLGVVFGTAWTPCVGPLLGTALVAAAGTASPWRGAAALSAYAAGLRSTVPPGVGRAGLDAGAPPLPAPCVARAGQGRRGLPGDDRHRGGLGPPRRGGGGRTALRPDQAAGRPGGEPVQVGVTGARRTDEGGDHGGGSRPATGGASPVVAVPSDARDRARRELALLTVREFRRVVPVGVPAAVGLAVVLHGRLPTAHLVAWSGPVLGSPTPWPPRRRCRRSLPARPEPASLDPVRGPARWSRPRSAPSTEAGDGCLLPERTVEQLYLRDPSGNR